MLRELAYATAMRALVLMLSACFRKCTGESDLSDKFHLLYTKDIFLNECKVPRYMHLLDPILSLSCCRGLLLFTDIMLQSSVTKSEEVEGSAQKLAKVMEGRSQPNRDQRYGFPEGHELLEMAPSEK